MRLAAIAVVGCLFAIVPARAGEIVEYKGVELIRQEERGVMVFKTKDGELKATPSGTMKGYDLNGKENRNTIDAAEKKEHSFLLLKVGNQFDVKINKVNAKTFYIAEVRLLKGELLTPGTANKVEKANTKPDDKKSDPKPNDKKPAEDKKPDEAKPDDKKPVVKKKEETHSYANAIIKKYDNKMLTFEVKGEEYTVEVPGSFKATDISHVLKKDDRYSAFKEGNVATISTKMAGKKEQLTSIRVTKHAAADK
jgi:hypothetical protein